MKLPIFDNLNTNPPRSTYYTFSKSMKDLDNAVTEGTEWYFTKMVCLDLPIWSIGNMFFRFRKTSSSPDGDIKYFSEENGKNFPELETTNYINPNIVIPRLLQYYTENIIRQSNIGSSEYIAELAFWKTLNMMGIDIDTLYDTNKIITYVGDLSTASFTEIANNHGWAEIIGSVTNNCPLTNISYSSWKTINDVNNIINADDNGDSAIFDKDSSFGFDMSKMKKVLNFYRIENDKDTTKQQEFQFNTILLFYTDKSGVNKLHGVDFIYPFVEGMNGWKQESIKHITNTFNSFAYSFRYNMKSCVNKNTQDTVYEINEGSFYDVFSKSMSNYDSFLELQRQKGDII